MVDDGRHERLLRLHPRAAQRLELRQRLEDGGARGIDVQVVQPKHVAEEARDSALEGVQLRERVVADPEQDVHAQRRPRQDLRERLAQRAAACRPW